MKMLARKILTSDSQMMELITRISCLRVGREASLAISARAYIFASVISKLCVRNGRRGRREERSKRREKYHFSRSIHF